MADKVILIDALAKEVINRVAKVVAKRTGDTNPILDKDKERSDTEYKVWWMLKPKKGAKDTAFANVIYVEVGMYEDEGEWKPYVTANVPQSPHQCFRGFSEPLTWDDVKNRRDEIAKSVAEYVWKWFDCVQEFEELKRAGQSIIEEAKAPAKEHPPEETPKEEISPLEACVSGTEEVLWKAYEAEFKLKGFKAKRPAWLKELAEKVCREEMTMAQAMAETLRRAKIDVSEEIYRRVIGKKAAEVVELEKPPEEKPPEEKRPTDVEAELTRFAEERLKRLGVKDVEEKLSLLPVAELTHAVRGGRLDVEGAEHIIAVALTVHPLELLREVDWLKVLGKRGKIDPFRVEEKLLAEVERLEKRLLRAGVKTQKAVKEGEKAPAKVGGVAKLPPWIYDELTKPEVIWDIVNIGVKGYLDKLRASHPDAQNYVEEVYSLAKRALDKIKGAIEANPHRPFYQAMALHMLNVGETTLLSGGVRAFHRAHFGSILVWLRQAGPVGQAVYEFYRTHPYIYWSETPAGIVVSTEGGTFRVPTGVVLLRLAGAAMLSAMGVSPWEVIPEPEKSILRRAFELIGEWAQGGGR